MNLGLVSNYGVSLSFLSQVLDSHVFCRKQLDDEYNEKHISAEDAGDVDEASILYCERFMEFLIDLLSQLPTRR